MPVYSPKDFAALVHVSKAAISKAVNVAGTLVLNADRKIDTDNPLNADYLARRQGAAIKAAIILPSGKHPTTKAPPKPAKAAAPHIDRGPPAGSSEAKPEDTVSPPAEADAPKKPKGSAAIDKLVEREIAASGLDSDKKRAQIQLWRKQAERHGLAIAEKKGELIPRDIIRRRYSALDAALKTHFRDLPRRTAARLHAEALANPSSPRALETALELEISEALARVVQAAKAEGLAE